MTADTQTIGMRCNLFSQFFRKTLPSPQSAGATLKAGNVILYMHYLVDKRSFKRRPMPVCLALAKAKGQSTSHRDVR